MFGPLLIENGVTRKPGGALISIRNMPNLTASSSKELLEFLADPSAWHMVDGEEVVHNDLLSVSGDRRVYAASKPVKQRRFMRYVIIFSSSCRKVALIFKKKW